MLARIPRGTAPRRLYRSPLESAPIVAGKERYRLPNNLAVVHLNRNETDFLFEEIFENQTYFKHGITIEDGDCVFDVGANIGLFSLSAHLSAPNVRLYSFEPSPPVHELLATNMQIYGANAKVFCQGLSSKRGSTYFTLYPKFSILSGLYADRAQDAQVVRSFIRKHWSGPENGSAGAEVEELLEDRFESNRSRCSLPPCPMCCARKM